MIGAYSGCRFRHGGRMSRTRARGAVAFRFSSIIIASNDFSYSTLNSSVVRCASCGAMDSSQSRVSANTDTYNNAQLQISSASGRYYGASIHGEL
jgi:hypothetical protein